MTTTWQLSYERLKERSRAAADLLEFWTYLDHDDLDHELLRDSKMSFDPPPRLVEIVRSESKFREIIADLVKTSLITSSGEDKWSMQWDLHKWLCSSLRTATDQELLQWSVICVGSKAVKRGTSDYWRLSIRLHRHASCCMEDIAGLQNVQVPQGLEDMWHDRLLGLARLCIARRMNIEKAEKVLLLVITGNCNITGSNTVIHPATYSEVRLSALNTLGNMYEDKGSWAKAANIYRSSMLILQVLDRPKPLWLWGSCENYVAVLSPDLLQDSDLQSPAFLPQTQKIVRSMREMKEADTMLDQASEQSCQKKFKEAAALFDALRKRLPLPQPARRADERTIRVWRDAGVCHAQLKNYGIARDIFEDVLPVAKMLRGGETNALTLDIMNNYGVVCREFGEFEKAEDLLTLAVQGREPGKGLGDALYLNAVENLGKLLAQRGRHERAREMFELCMIEAERGHPHRLGRIEAQMARLEIDQSEAAAFED